MNKERTTPFSIPKPDFQKGCTFTRIEVFARLLPSCIATKDNIDVDVNVKPSFSRCAYRITQPTLNDAHSKLRAVPTSRSKSQSVCFEHEDFGCITTTRHNIDFYRISVIVPDDMESKAVADMERALVDVYYETLNRLISECRDMLSLMATHIETATSR
tara:strand:+ start:910 stop:1386 length:477 start_codon:yes stop_codon:yes gene_type:complete